MRLVNKRWRSLFLSGLYTWCAIAVLWIGVGNPHHNWDMLAYAGAAFALETGDVEQIHHQVFSTLEKHVGAKKYQALTRGKYRQAMATDAQLFSKQQPFYKPRVIYNALVLALNKIGINIFFSTSLISSVFASASVIVLLLLAKQTLNFGSALAVPFFAISFGILELARYSTPDALATFVVLLTATFILRGHVWALALLPISVFVRTDLIIWCGIITLYLFWTKQFSMRSVLISAGLAICAYFLVNSWADNYGWQTIFYFTFVEQVLDPSSLASPMTAKHYFRQILEGLNGAFTNKEFMLFAALTLLVFIRFWREPEILRSKGLTSDRLLFFGLVPALYVFLHFVFFPVIWTRFFTGFYLIGVIGFLWLHSDAKGRMRASIIRSQTQ